MITRRDAVRLFVAAGPAAAARGNTELFHGRKDALPEVISLQAGPVTAIFDIETSALRWVRVGGREVVRAIYAAVRDSDWGTVEPRLHDLRVTSTGDSFELTFVVDCVRPPYDFVWNGRITGDAAGTVRFSFDGEARSTFLRNRLGFAMLHPVRECAGNPCEVETEDGQRQKGVFPKLVSPHQPFFGLKSITHEVLPGVKAQVKFEGEVFEMEDHRNWTDASYKTYCTPLAKPYPVEVKQGTRVSQAIEIRLHGQAPPPPRRARRSPEPVGIQVDLARVTPAPKLGLGVASHGQRLSAQEIARLRALRPHHLRVDVRPGAEDYAPAIRRAASEAAALGAKLEVAAHMPESASGAAADLAKQLAAVKAPLAGLIAYRPKNMAADVAWLADIRKAFPGVRIGVGTDDGFVQLNRNRPTDPGDALCWSINPQVHAIDNSTIVENLEAQADTIESARAFAGGKPVWISPVTLKMRYNPNAKDPNAPAPAGQLPPNVDVRQLSLFGAGWTAISLKYLGEAGAERVTLYETSGWRGVQESPRGSALPRLFPSTAGEVFPLYHVLADYAEMSAGQVVRSVSAAPLEVDALVMRRGTTTRIVIANFTHEIKPVRVAGVPTAGSARVLGEGTVRDARGTPESYRASRPVGADARALLLRPYEVLRLDV